MATSTRRGSKADTPASSPGANDSGVSVDIHKRMEVMQTTLMLKMDEMTGIFRCELSNAVQAIEKTLNALNADNVKLRKELVEVKQVAEENATKVNKLKVQLDLVKRHSVENEQYSRKSNMRVFGVKQVRGEDCKTIVTEMLQNKLGKKVVTGDIVCAHRIPGKTMPPPIIVQFSSRELKLDVMKRRRSLKGSGIVIADDLCLDMVQTLSRLKALPTVVKSWSWDGKLFAQIPSGTIVKVRFAETLDEAIQKLNGNRK